VIPSLFGDTRRLLLLVIVSIIGIAMTVRTERTSGSRANRLHRADAIDEAARIYRAHVADDPEDTRLRYNLGTTLLRLGVPGAYEELTAGASTGDESQRAHALYNLGLWAIITAVTAPTTDSVLFHAAYAVEANKGALRIDPDHENAKWNLAFAQWVIANAGPEPGLMDPGDITGPDNIGERLETANPMELANREGLEEVAVVPETEAPAGDDLEPLSQVAASQILGTSHLNPTRIMLNMLSREARFRRGRGSNPTGPPW
jgi:hypothetical protein